VVLCFYTVRLTISFHARNSFQFLCTETAERGTTKNNTAGLSEIKDKSSSLIE
jgi:hypothetical protein